MSTHWLPTPWVAVGRGSMWTALWTKPRCEAIAEENAKNQDYETLLLRCSRRAGAPVEPLFPGYLLINLRPDQCWGPLRSTRGAVALVMSGTRPARLPDAEVGWWRSRQNSRGIIVLDEVLFQHGQDVLVDGKSSPLHGARGEFDCYLSAPGRVRVLFSMLGAQVPVTLRETELAAA
jgi:transcription antitermination factor NusG